MMRAVENGGNRQELHEKLRVHSQAAALVIKQGGECDLQKRIAGDPDFKITEHEIEELLDPALYVGCAPEQTEEFLSECINPLLAENKDLLGEKAELSV